MVKKNKNIFRKLFQKHTLIILNEESQEEQFSVRVNRMNVMVILVLFTFFTVAVTTLTLLYTPIHDYILPSQKQANVKDKQEILRLTDKVIELESRTQSNDIYIRNLRSILAGEVPMPEIDNTNQQFTTSVDLGKVDLSPTQDDLKLREEVEREEMFSVSGSAQSSESGNLLFTPLKGIVT